MIFNIISNREWIYTQVTVTIKGNTSTVTYDAASHTASGYTVTISDPTYTTSDFTFSGTSSVSRTAAGTSNMGLAASQFTNKNSRYRNVVFNVTDGYVKINQKAVTVKADNKSKTYGASDPTLTATVTGTLGSDKVTYSLSRASGSNVGTYTITPSGTASQGNYSVSFSTGTFTINKAAASALGLSVSGGTYTYNGTARSVSASVSVTSGTTIQYSTNNSSWSTTKPTYTNVGTNTTYVRAGNSNYDTATANANIVINKAAASALGLSVSGYSALYNGSAHSITATTTVTSGTTIYYSSNGSSGWTTTKPTLTNVGSITTYVKAVNANYNDATGNATVVNKCRITVTTNPSASVAFGSSATVTANSSGVATYDAPTSGNWTITVSKSGMTSKSGTVNVPTNSASASITLMMRVYLYHDGTQDVAWTSNRTISGSYMAVDAYDYVRTTSTVNLSGFSNLYVEYLTSHGASTYWVPAKAGYTGTAITSSDATLEGSTTLDNSLTKVTKSYSISSINTTKYIAITNGGGSSMGSMVDNTQVYKVYLE